MWNADAATWEGRQVAGVRVTEIKTLFFLTEKTGGTWRGALSVAPFNPNPSPVIFSLADLFKVLKIVTFSFHFISFEAKKYQKVKVFYKHKALKLF